LEDRTTAAARATAARNRIARLKGELGQAREFLDGGLYPRTPLVGRTAGYLDMVTRLRFVLHSTQLHSRWLNYGTQRHTGAATTFNDAQRSPLAGVAFDEGFSSTPSTSTAVRIG